jgi:hypothetical protein
MTCRKCFPVLSSFMTYHMIGFVNRLTRRMPLVEQDLLTLPEHLSSSPVFSVIRITRSLVLCVCSFGHCVVCSSVFWSLCCLFFCLLAIVLSVLLSFGHCVVCSSVFWPLCCLFFCLLAIVLSVLLRYTNSDYLFVIFKLFLDNICSNYMVLLFLNVFFYLYI